MLCGVAEGQLVNGNSYWARINSDGARPGCFTAMRFHIPARHTVLSLILGPGAGEVEEAAADARLASRIRRREPRSRRIRSSHAAEIGPAWRTLTSTSGSSRACPTIRGGRFVLLMPIVVPET